jgi:hypothetical protein
MINTDCGNQTSIFKNLNLANIVLMNNLTTPNNLTILHIDDNKFGPEVRFIICSPITLISHNLTHRQLAHIIENVGVVNLFRIFLENQSIPTVIDIIYVGWFEGTNEFDVVEVETLVVLIGGDALNTLETLQIEHT